MEARTFLKKELPHIYSSDSIELSDVVQAMNYYADLKTNNKRGNFMLDLNDTGFWIIINKKTTEFFPAGYDKQKTLGLIDRLNNDDNLQITENWNRLFVRPKDAPYDKKFNNWECVIEECT